MSTNPARRKRLLHLLLMTLCCLPFIGSGEGRSQNQTNDTPRQGTPWQAVVAPDNLLEFIIRKGARPALNLGMVGWAPNWSWRHIGADRRGDGRVFETSSRLEVDAETGQIVDIQLAAQQVDRQAIAFRYSLQAERDVPLTQLAASLSTPAAAREGEAVITQPNGRKVRLPLSLANAPERVTAASIRFESRQAGPCELKIEPPVPLHVENGLRLLFVEEKFPAGAKIWTLTFKFPEQAILLAGAEDTAQFSQTLPGPDWFPLSVESEPGNEIGPSAIGFENWLEKPAGKRGRVRMNGDRFEFEDKTPVKFWGTNLSYRASAPEETEARFMAARFAKWGVNAVRMHKFTGSDWEGIGDANDATMMTGEGWQRLDYFADQLTRNGVYYGWSHTFGFKPKAGNRDRLWAPEEIEKNLNGNTYSLINIAPDVQDLMIEMVVNLLSHRNPYTGKTYAEDPALAFIELQNEDSIFFYTTDSVLNSAPTYKRRLVERWTDWLRVKYGTMEALRAAWPDAVREGENFDERNIEIQGNPWFFGDDHLPNQSGGARQRLLDNAAFLHEEQNKFYSRFTRAIRETGYQGPLVGSPWFAPSTLPDMYNLKSDALVGYVDRHNYFGEKLFDTMLPKPGSGYLSSGLQQVAGRPFGLSEWIHVFPTLYSTEGPAIVAAYGMGLQGWDASYEFQSSAGSTEFASAVYTGAWGQWNADVPTQLGQYPILARMIARGDIKEGAPIAVRRVSTSDLASGTFNFSSRSAQQGDVKSFGGSVPEEALAAGRCLVDFTDAPQDSTFPDLARHRQGETIRSNTGQLAWTRGEQSHITIDTPGTKAVVGFAAERPAQLGDVRITLHSPYASLFITAAEPGENLINAKRALISAMARNSNTGLSYFTPDNRILNNGTGPILMEPVKATISFANRPIAMVNVLSHNGQLTGRKLPNDRGQFIIDGAQDKTMYYEVVFAD